jgi:signal peptidase I
MKCLKYVTWEKKMFNKKKKNTELEEINDLEEIELDIVDLDKEKVEEKEVSWAREIISTAVYLLAVVAVTFLFVQFVGQRTHVNGDSMNVTLEDGDNLIVDKLSYRFSEPERYDIIVFPYQYQEKTYYIKRIIGMPGETVQIINGMVYIDGEMLDESYGKEVMQYSGVASDPIELGDDEYFVLGDNRNNSSDSRDPSVGNIKEDQIIGKAFIRIWPLNKFGILKHQ